MHIFKRNGKDVLVQHADLFALLELRGKRGYECLGVWQLEMSNWEPQFRFIPVTTKLYKEFSKRARQFCNVYGFYEQNAPAEK